MPRESITKEETVNSRRLFLRHALNMGLLPIAALPHSSLSNQRPLILTPEKLATSYNNYYEFSSDKSAVRHLSASFKLAPWNLSIEGLVEKPISLSISKLPDSTERVYRFRCIEGWSMTVPWHGFSLKDILSKAKPKSNAKYVRFVSVFRPSEMIGQRRNTLDWPYTEGLRLDEAMHPLTLLATGMYGKALPAQNGGPLRLVVPWKYGFKSIKAIVKIELVAKRPATTWNMRAPSEYGFYANVNPDVPHPRWSQRREVPLGELKKVPTRLFNGYQEDVAHLYENMDLAKHY